VKRYWFRRETEPDPTTPKHALRYTGRAEIFRSALEHDDTTELIAIVDSVEVAMKMVELANEEG
jgi:hypothetical protein